MSTARPELSAVRTRYYSHWLVFGVLGAVTLLLVFHTSQRIQNQIAVRTQLSEQSSQGASTLISMFLDRLRSKVQLFTEDEGARIAALSRDSTDENLYQGLEFKVARHFPEFFSFTIADNDGKVLLDDFEGTVGEVCRHDIRGFAAHQHPQDVFIHPNPDGYHFDIMAPWRGADGEVGIFFLSFRPLLISSVLASSQLSGHQLLLLLRDSPGLIEIAAAGDRLDLQRDAHLSAEEQSRVLSRFPVAGTRWDLVDLPPPDWITALERSQWTQSAVMLAGVLGFALVMLAAMRREERKRGRAETELLDSHRELEQRVRARTRQLSDANRQLQQEIGEREATRNALAESEERYALAVLGSNDGIWDWKVKAGEIYFSSRWKGMIGEDAESFADRIDSWLNRVASGDRALLTAALDELHEGQGERLDVEYRMTHRDGSLRWFHCSGAAMRDGDGRVVRIAGSQSDITARKLVERQLVHDALHDGLTQLPNRALFLDRLVQSIRLSRRYGEARFAVLFLDLDGFKLINDSMGHLAGDEMLRAVASRLAGSIRPEDTLARLGGDEFAILMEGIHRQDEVTQLAERVQEALQDPLIVRGQKVYSSISIGIAVGTSQYQEPEDLLRDADAAMYRAKAAGKARYVIFDNVFRQEVLRRMQLENDLRQALDQGQLVVNYQPIVALNTGRVIGFEALLRWHHPEKGLIMPVDFIPMAEETGMIVSIGAWVLEESCRQVRRWQQQDPSRAPLYLSVNLSCAQFTQEDLKETFQAILSRNRFDTHLLDLNLEITETVIMRNAECAAGVLQDLKSLGVRLSVDDFGTGYSSLGYLQRFPIDTIKIDKSFVGRMERDRESLSIVQAVIGLARNLGKTVVAEGVENETQLALLKELGCDYAQGFLFARPLPPLDAEPLIKGDSDAAEPRAAS